MLAMPALTDFYSPTDAPPGCRVSVSSSAVSIGAGAASFTVRRGELHVRWQTPWTGDEQRWRPVSDVVAVRACADERTADGQKSERLELTWRDGETIAPMVRQKPAAVRWVEGRLHDVLGLAPGATAPREVAAAVAGG